MSPIITKPMQTITDQQRHNQTRIVSGTCFRPLPPIPKYNEETLPSPPPPPPPKHISQVWQMSYLNLILIKRFSNDCVITNSKYYGFYRIIF